MSDAGGRSAVDAVLAAVAASLPQPPQAAWAGVTGLDPGQAEPFAQRLAAVLSLDALCSHAGSDIELLCRAALEQGGGIVVYAGTGSFAARLDAAGRVQRAGGRGGLIDDAGSGPWIAREALKAVWRAEDETPGSWQRSALARALFARIGGSDWDTTRAWVYGAARGRGELGTLALAVAEAAAEDADARRLLERAGTELARLALALIRRTGAAPVVWAGRACELHPALLDALATALPEECMLQPLQRQAHHVAARLALALAPPAGVATR
jgi:N-acetylglucosamine kinase-like BadF-type ATPase